MAENPQPVPEGGPRRQNIPLRVPKPRVAARYPIAPSATTSDLKLRNYTGGGEVNLIVTRNDAFAPRLFNTCVVMACDPEATEVEACAYFLSAMVAACEALLPDARRVIESWGYRVHIVGDDEMGIINHRLQPWIEKNQMVATFCQMAYLLFKNIDEVSYDRAIAARSKGIKSQASCNVDLGGEVGVDKIFEVERAALFNRRIGGHTTFKGRVLNVFVAGRNHDDPWGPACRYMCEIFQWVDMTQFVLIYNTLVLSRSPVLYQKMLLQELMHLGQAVDAVESYSMPQFFRIQCPQQANLLLRNHMRILGEVAHTIAKETTPSLGNFQTSGNNDPATIDRLVNLHRAHMENNDQIAKTNYHASLFASAGMEAADDNDPLDN